MCIPRNIIGRLMSMYDSAAAEADGFSFSGFGINGIIYKHVESGQELDEYELIRRYPVKEENNG